MRHNPSKINNKSEQYTDFLFNCNLQDCEESKHLFTLYKNSNYGYSSKWYKNYLKNKA
jgi:hypothetical protein